MLESFQKLQHSNVFEFDSFSEEMKAFARHWVDPTFQFSWLLLAILGHLALLLGTIVSLLSRSWLSGPLVALAKCFLVYTFLFLVWYGGNRSVLCELQSFVDYFMYVQSIPRLSGEVTLATQLSPLLY